MNKYKNKKVYINGEIFDSQKEYKTYLKLKGYENLGLIKDLKRQVAFELIPKQYETTVKTIKGKEKITKKVIEQDVKYIADFTFTIVKTNEFCVVDTKGIKTKEYIIKRKLMLYIHNIKIMED